MATYTYGEKKKIAKYAQANGIPAATRRYSPTYPTIKKWIKQFKKGEKK